MGSFAPAAIAAAAVIVIAFISKIIEVFFKMSILLSQPENETVPPVKVGFGVAVGQCPVSSFRQFDDSTDPDLH